MDTSNDETSGHETKVLEISSQMTKLWVDKYVSTELMLDKVDNIGTYVFVHVTHHNLVPSFGFFLTDQNISPSILLISASPSANQFCEGSCGFLRSFVHGVTSAMLSWQRTCCPQAPACALVVVDLEFVQSKAFLGQLRNILANAPAHFVFVVLRPDMYA